MARHIFIVGNAHRDLYDLLVRRFEGDGNVTVVLDRRKTGEGTDSSMPLMVQDYRPLITDLHVRAEVEAELKSRSHAIVTVPD